MEVISITYCLLSKYCVRPMCIFINNRLFNMLDSCARLFNWLNHCKSKHTRQKLTTWITFYCGYWYFLTPLWWEVCWNLMLLYQLKRLFNAKWNKSMRMNCEPGRIMREVLGFTWMGWGKLQKRKTLLDKSYSLPLRKPGKNGQEDTWDGDVSL